MLTGRGALPLSLLYSQPILLLNDIEYYKQQKLYQFIRNQ